VTYGSDAPLLSAALKLRACHTTSHTHTQIHAVTSTIVQPSQSEQQRTR
jgi:hypothetical protein